MIAILTAMGKEFDIVKSALSPSMYKSCSKDMCYGWLNNKFVIAIKTGIGKVNATYALTNLLATQHGIEKVFSLGCAGAVIPDLRIGDIVIGNSYCYHDVWCGEPCKEGQVQGQPAVYHSSFETLDTKDIHLGMIASGDWFVQNREKAETILNYLPSTYNIIAVDMESAALAQVCHISGIPFVSVRVISDNPLLPKQEKQYSDFWDEIAKKCFTSLLQII